MAEYQDGALGLVTETVWVDSVAFTALCQTADTAPSPGDRLALLERAYALYAGDFLSQASPPWAEPERTRLRTLYHSVHQAVAALAITGGPRTEAGLHTESARSRGAATQEKGPDDDAHIPLLS
jgi:two-component SAPR family response regulator